MSLKDFVVKYLQPHARCTLTHLRYWYPSDVNDTFMEQLDAAVKARWVLKEGTDSRATYTVTKRFITDVKVVKPAVKPPCNLESALMDAIQSLWTQGFQDALKCDHSSCAKHAHSLNPSMLMKAVPTTTVDQALKALRRPEHTFIERVEHVTRKGSKPVKHYFFHFVVPKPDESKELFEEKKDTVQSTLRGYFARRFKQDPNVEAYFKALHFMCLLLSGKTVPSEGNNEWLLLDACLEGKENLGNICARKILDIFKGLAFLPHADHRVALVYLLYHENRHGTHGLAEKLERMYDSETMPFKETFIAQAIYRLGLSAPPSLRTRMDKTVKQEEVTDSTLNNLLDTLEAYRLLNTDACECVLCKKYMPFTDDDSDDD